MTRSEILLLVRRGAVNAALPRPVAAQCLIVAVRVSKCCGAPSILVRSRAGGFISQDCLECGQNSEYVNESDIPNLDCALCLKFGRKETVEPKKIRDNYWYECGDCRRKWEIASIIPHWSDTFEYAGLAAPGDPGFQQ